MVVFSIVMNMNTQLLPKGDNHNNLHQEKGVLSVAGQQQIACEREDKAAKGGQERD